MKCIHCNCVTVCDLINPVVNPIPVLYSRHYTRDNNFGEENVTESGTKPWQNNFLHLVRGKCQQKKIMILKYLRLSNQPGALCHKLI
jgi:hypothetical protein